MIIFPMQRNSTSSDTFTYLAHSRIKPRSGTLEFVYPDENIPSGFID